MTGLEMFKAWLDQEGVEYVEGPRQVLDGQHEDGRTRLATLPGTTITLDQTISKDGVLRHVEKVAGYSHFFIMADFDADGSLIQIGAWE